MFFTKEEVEEAQSNFRDMIHQYAKEMVEKPDEKTEHLMTLGFLAGMSTTRDVVVHLIKKRDIPALFDEYYLFHVAIIEKMVEKWKAEEIAKKKNFLFN